MLAHIFLKRYCVVDDHTNINIIGKALQIFPPLHQNNNALFDCDEKEIRNYLYILVPFEIQIPI